MDFENVKTLFIGDHRARAVCGFSLEQGLLHVIDSVSRQNYTYLLEMGGGEVSLHKIAKINGSCIYSTRVSGEYLFSTTVESGESNGNRFKNLLSYKREAGILSDDVHVIYVSKQLEPKIVGAFKKDKLPYKLFQYGAVRFPRGLEKTNMVVLYPFAIKRYDGSALIKGSENFVMNSL